MQTLTTDNTICLQCLTVVRKVADFGASSIMQLKCLIFDVRAKPPLKLLLALKDTPSLVELNLGKTHLQLTVGGVEDQIERCVVLLDVCAYVFSVIHLEVWVF